MMACNAYSSVRKVRFLAGSALVSSAALLVSSPAQAACDLLPGAGDDSFVCDSGSSPGLNDVAGDNVLTLPAGGTGSITGSVSLGAGTDRVEVHSGSIGGTVDQGDGADAFIISGGSVAGNIQQGAGVDDFVMIGGEIASLNQGDNFDTFFMSGGRIIGFFEDGDYAEMTGGRIGRVNMKLDDNTFDMSGGAIDENLVTGFGNDTIILSGGTIGGNISVSGGTDSVTVTGGSVGGEVRMSTGDDRFTWDGGGIIYGMVDLDQDNDTAFLRNLTNAHIGSLPQFTGGTGTDSLSFDNVKTDRVGRFSNWESIALANDSQLVFDGALTLGDPDTGTGTVTIDASSTLLGGGARGGIAPFAATQLASVVNAGRIDLTNGGGGTGDSFTIRGNYAGNNARLLLNTVVGADDSPSDKLTIDGGIVSGMTAIDIFNAGGTGAATNQNGILVIQGVNGADTGSGTFALNGRVAAGAYEYLLFKGGVSAGTEESWYLRSTIVDGPSPAPTPLPPPGETPQPVPEEGVTPVIDDLVVLYRPEVAAYAVVPPIAHDLAMTTLGTFHDRRGEQSLLSGGEGILPASWGRVFAQYTEKKWGGTVDPSINGDLQGFQVGQDLWGGEGDGGHTDRFGIFFGYAETDGRVKGQALGWNDLTVGSMDANSSSVGGYWTHIGASGWYLDAIVMITWFDGSTRAFSGEAITLDGTGVTASLEGGYPFALSDGWVLEPQGQIIWNRLSLDDQADSFSTVYFDRGDSWTARLGLRLEGDVETGAGRFQPHLSANLWQSFSGEQVLSFGSDQIVTDLDGTTLELGGGFTVNVTPGIGLFGAAGYQTNLGGQRTQVFEGNAGLSIKW